MSTSATYDIFFTGPTDNPRHNCVMIGFLDDTENRPFYLSFETPDIPTSETITTVFKNNRQPVASFEWTAKNYLGMATIGRRKMSMTLLVQPGPNSNTRRFITTDGRLFEWRKTMTPNLGMCYELSSGPAIPALARFARFPQPQVTPVGPAYALLSCKFDDELLLFEASLALCVNRWIDLHGLWS